MDSASLQTFLTVAQLSSFTDAAEKLYLTQSAVSKRVAALENELNSRLLDRIGKQVLLTEAGKVLAARAQSLLTEIADTRREISNLSAEVAGRLSVGTSHHVGLHRLPGILQNFSSQYPEVELDLHFMNSEKICDAIKNGDLELGVITLPLQPIEQLSSHPIWNDRLEFTISRRHPLIQDSLTTQLNDGGISCPLKTLAEHSAILPTRGTFTRAIVDGVFAENKLKLTTKMETNYLETIKMLVGVGLGWSVLPHTMLDSGVTKLQVPGVKISRKLGAVWHTSRTLSNAAKKMLLELENNLDL